MEIVRTSTNEHEPTLVRVAELTTSELNAPSGVFDEELGRDLRVLELIAVLEEVRFGAQKVAVDPNGYCSQETRDHRSRIAKGALKDDEPEEPRFAVISHRPPFSTLE